MKATPENKVKAAILQALSTTKTKPSRWPGLRLFSNPRGTAWHTYDKFQRPVAYGLAPGSKQLASSDFIGWYTRTVTPDMVGIKIAQFVSVEVKAAGKKETPEQRAWLNMVFENWGIAQTVYSLEDLDECFLNIAPAAGD